MKLLLCLTALFTLGTLPAFAGKSGWDDDYSKALAEAAKDKKMVLLDFTGSDWCGYCIKLDDQVFSKPPFKQLAREHLVLVKLDFPRGKRLPKKTQEQNAELKTKFGIRGYPTVVLVDAEGKEQARWVGFNSNLVDELKAKLGGSSKEAPSTAP
jgi:thioredoxin-related protein